MRSIRRVISRTKSGDRTSPSPLGRSSRSPTRRSRSRNKGPLPPETDAFIFCHDMYTIDFVLDHIQLVGMDGKVDTVVFEDLIERNNETLTQAVQDLFVETTMCLDASAENDDHDDHDDDAKNPMHDCKKQSTDDNHPQSKSGDNGRKKQKPMKRRFWKSIAFVDCVSDASSYKKYLEFKHDFLVNLERFLTMEGFQNDLPIRFEAKIEIHTFLDGQTILDLLRAVQRDTTVTRIVFGGALSHTERHVPEEFDKLIDKESLTVKEVFVIHLHYDKQSINMDADDNDEAGAGVKNRRQSHLDPESLATIQRCAIIMDQHLHPDMLGDSFSETSEPFDFSNFNLDSSYDNQNNINNSSERKETESEESRVNSRPKEAIKKPQIGTRQPSTNSDSKTSNISRRRDVSVKEDASGNDKHSPRRKVKRSVSIGSEPLDLASGRRRGPKRSISIDDSFWEKGFGAPATRDKPDPSRIKAPSKNETSVAARTKTLDSSSRRKSRSPDRSQRIPTNESKFFDWSQKTPMNDEAVKSHSDHSARRLKKKESQKVDGISKIPPRLQRANSDTPPSLRTFSRCENPDFNWGVLQRATSDATESRKAPPLGNRSLVVTDPDFNWNEFLDDSCNEAE